MSLLTSSFGCAVGVLNGGPIAGRIDELSSVGIEWIEPQFSRLDAFDAEDETFLRESRRRISDAGLRVWSVHSPFGKEVDISSEDIGIRERGIAGIKRAILGCAALGGRIVVVHMSDNLPKGGDRAVYLGIARKSIDQIVEVARDNGIQIAIENLLPNFLGESAEELLSVVDSYPPETVGVCLDTGHANVKAGGDPEKAVAIARALANRIITTHLHDNDGTGDQHQVPGFGNIDWCEMSKTLAESTYDGPLMFEVTGPGSHEEAISRLPEATSTIRKHMGN